MRERERREDTSLQTREKRVETCSHVTYECGGVADGELGVDSDSLSTRAMYDLIAVKASDFCLRKES